MADAETPAPAPELREGTGREHPEWEQRIRDDLSRYRLSHVAYAAAVSIEGSEVTGPADVDEYDAGAVAVAEVLDVARWVESEGIARLIGLDPDDIEARGLDLEETVGEYLDKGRRALAREEAAAALALREGTGKAVEGGPAAMLAEFHAAAGQTRVSDDAGLALRAKLQREETEELAAALESWDTYEIARELADVVYVAYGTAHTLGIPLDAVLAEVHRANMSKRDPETGQFVVREDGKVLKGPHFVAPDIAAALATPPSPALRVEGGRGEDEPITAHEPTREGFAGWRNDRSGRTEAYRGGRRDMFDEAQAVHAERSAADLAWLDEEIGKAERAGEGEPESADVDHDWRFLFGREQSLREVRERLTAPVPRGENTAPTGDPS